MLLCNGYFPQKYSRVGIYVNNEVISLAFVTKHVLRLTQLFKVMQSSSVIKWFKILTCSGLRCHYSPNVFISSFKETIRDD